MNDKLVAEHRVVPAIRKFDAVFFGGFAPGPPLAETRRSLIAVPVVEKEHAAVGEMSAGEQMIEHFHRRAVEIAVEMHHREFRRR